MSIFYWHFELPYNLVKLLSINQKERSIMLKENVTTTTLSHNEIVFIKKLVEDEFKSTNPCESFNLKEKVFALCNKLNVTSFEEVVRKVLFYNLFSLDITEEYLAHIESCTRDNIAVRNCIRNVMIDLAMNTSDVFCDFAYHTHYFDDEDKQEEVKTYIERINADNDTYRMFGMVNSLVNVVNSRHDFDMLFNKIFTLKDEGYIQDSEIVLEKLNSYSAKYLFITWNLIEYCFPIRLKNELTSEQIELIRFLLYKGDEIDYMKEKNIPPIIFNDKLKGIINTYNVDDLQELQITATIEKELKEASLIWDYSSMLLRSGTVLSCIGRNPHLISESNKVELNNLVKGVTECLTEEVFSGSKPNEYMKMLEDLEIEDYQFLNTSKIQPIAEWIKAIPNGFETLSRLQKLLWQIDDIFPIANLVLDDDE